MKRQLATATAWAMLCLSFASCSKNSSSTTPPVVPPVISVQLTNNTTLGKVLTDSAGNTLYFFSPDASGASNCTGGCLVAWPAYYHENPTVAAGLDTADFATITRTDGAKQTTYKGWPLYYYKNDLKPGDVNGEAAGTVWFVAKPDYSVMIAKIQLVGKDGIQYTGDYTPGTGPVQYLTDAYGKTLYAFSPDHFNVNNYTKSDFSNNGFWPIDEVTSVNKVPSTLSSSDFGTLTVFGKTQLSYKGWPLYFFGPDAGIRGNTKGVSVPAPGVWPIVNSSSPVAPL